MNIEKQKKRNIVYIHIDSELRKTDIEIRTLKEINGILMPLAELERTNANSKVMATYT